MKPRVDSAGTIAEGKFLVFRAIDYTDARGVLRRWEAVDRRRTPEAVALSEAHAVFIVAHIVPDDEILFVRQFRPPAGKLMVEFPAGLIDPGESPGQTAERELYEETGYRGKLCFCTRPGYSSPGMTGESIVLAAMEIDGEVYRGKTPEAHPEECENIEVFRVKVAELDHFIAEQERAGAGIDSKIYTWLAVRRLGL